MLSDKLNIQAKKKNMTVYRIAKLTGLSQSYVWEIFKGKKANPGIEIIKKIASVLEISLDELLK